MATGDTYPVVMGADKAKPGGVATLGPDGKLLAVQRPTLPDMGAVPVTRKVNGKPLSNDIVLIPPNIGAASNPNLLHNWYFADPINQRGQTEYAGGGYTIDRWKLTSGTKLSLIQDGLQMTVTKISTYPNIAQTFEDPQYFSGQTVTVSALVKKPDGALLTISLKPTTGGGSGAVNIITDAAFSDWTLMTATGTIPDNVENARLFIYLISPPVGSTVCVKAIKVEFGPIQTLAHQDANGNWVLNDPPPDKASELAKCQRYYYSFGTTLIGFGYTYGGGTLINGRLIAPQMRANPVLVNNKTGAGITTLDVAAADGSGAQHTEVPVKILSAYGGIGLSDTSLPNAIPVMLISQNNAALDANL